MCNPLKYITSFFTSPGTPEPKEPLYECSGTTHKRIVTIGSKTYESDTGWVWRNTQTGRRPGLYTETDMAEEWEAWWFLQNK